MKRWFWIDLISAIPFDLFKLRSDLFNLARLITMVKIIRLVKLENFLSQLRFNSYLRCLRLLVLLSHI